MSKPSRYMMPEREYADRLIVEINRLDIEATHAAPNEYATVDVAMAASAIPQMKSPRVIERIVKKLEQNGIIKYSKNVDGVLRVMITELGRDSAEHAIRNYIIAPPPPDR